MEKSGGIWIDQKSAAIINISNNKKPFSEVFSNIENRKRIPGETKTFGRFGKQYIDFEKKREHKFEQELHNYLVEIENQCKDFTHLVIFGPSTMKNKLAEFLSESYHFKGVILDVFPSRALSKNQKVALVKKYFEEHMLMH